MCMLIRYTQAWYIVGSHTLFHGEILGGVFDDRVHAAELLALLGPGKFRYKSQRRG